MSFWDIIWFIVISFAFIAYLMIMFQIIGDLFRDRSASGFVKAIWIVCLIAFPPITALLYLIARGQGMAERQAGAVQAMKAQQESYIRDVASQAGPAEQIAKAHEMLDAGTINQAEYDRIKEKALA